MTQATWTRPTLPRQGGGRPSLHPLEPLDAGAPTTGRPISVDTASMGEGHYLATVILSQTAARTRMHIDCIGSDGETSSAPLNSNDGRHGATVIDVPTAPSEIRLRIGGRARDADAEVCLQPLRRWTGAGAAPDDEPMPGSGQKMGARPSITVLLPVFNAAPDALRVTVAALLAQDHGAVDLVIVDDASTDAATRDALDALGAQAMDGVRFIRRTESGGEARALNTGLAEAKGDWIMAVQPGAVPMPGALTRMADQATATPAAKVVSAGIYEWSDRDQVYVEHVRPAPTAMSLMVTDVLGPCRMFARGELEGLRGWKASRTGAHREDLVLRALQRLGESAFHAIAAPLMVVPAKTEPPRGARLRIVREFLSRGASIDADAYPFRAMPCPVATSGVQLLPKRPAADANGGEPVFLVIDFTDTTPDTRWAETVIVPLKALDAPPGDPAFVLKASGARTSRAAKALGRNRLKSAAVVGEGATSWRDALREALDFAGGHRVLCLAPSFQPEEADWLAHALAWLDAPGIGAVVASDGPPFGDAPDVPDWPRQGHAEAVDLRASLLSPEAVSVLRDVLDTLDDTATWHDASQALSPALRAANITAIKTNLGRHEPS